MLSTDAIRRGCFSCEISATACKTGEKAPQEVTTCGSVPPWLDALNALTSNTWIAAADRKLLLTHTRATKSHTTVPYRCAFSQLTGRMMVDWQDCHGHHLIESAKYTVPADMACLCTDALAHISRYALQIDHVRSGESWRVWLQRFSFDKKEANPWQRIAGEFPVLIHRLHHQYTSFIDYFDTFFQRLSADRLKLATSLDLPPQTRISRFNPGFTRYHNDFRLGMGVVFENGTEVYYKPIPVDIELAFSRLLLLSEMNFMTPIGVVPGEGYGWLFRKTGKTSDTRVRNFSESLGAATACFWLLHADCIENIVADIGKVSALDLDTLLTPSTGQLAADHESSPRSHCARSRTSTLQCNQQNRVFEKKPLDEQWNAASHENYKPKNLKFILHSGCIAYRCETGSSTPHVSKHSGAVAPRVQKARVLQSFQNTLKGVVPRLIHDFADALEPHCVLRYRHRNFSAYQNLLDKLALPPMLRDSRSAMHSLMRLHDRERENDESDINAHILIDDEIRQLLHGDIPYFSYQVGDTALQLSDEVIDSFFSTSGVDRVRARVHGIEKCTGRDKATPVDLKLDGFATDSPAVFRLR